MSVKDVLVSVAVAYAGWWLGTIMYRKLGIHEIELFANSEREG